MGLMQNPASLSTESSIMAFTPLSWLKTMQPGSPTGGIGNGFPSSGKITPMVFFPFHMYDTTSSA